MSPNELAAAVNNQVVQQAYKFVFGTDDNQLRLLLSASVSTFGLARSANRYIGNVPPMPGVFPDYPAPVIGNSATGTVGARIDLALLPRVNLLIAM